MAEAAPALRPGVAFPVGENGRVSTTVVAKKIWSAAVRGVDVQLANAIDAERDWRYQYPGHLCKLADLGAKSPANAVKIAEDGLNTLRGEFVFVKDGAAAPLIEAMSTAPAAAAALHTGTLQGGAAVAPLAIPIEDGADALAMLRELGAAGTCEPSVASSVEKILGDTAQLAATLSEHVFVLLGGTSELCPCLTLARAGATVVVISRPGEKLNTLLRYLDRETAGTIVVPLSRPQTEADDAATLGEVAGADVIERGPELITWLAALYPSKKMVIGSYIYVDGEAHVRASVAMDSVLAGVVAARPAGYTAAAYLGSPATAHVISREAWEDSRARFEGRPWYHAPFGFAQNHRPLVEGVTATGGAASFAVTDGFAVFQGPNYALAKTLQCWRATLLVQQGVPVSMNMAPGSRTDSVQHSWQAAAAIEGMAWFEPLRAFDPGFVAATMAVLLLWDLSPAGVAAQKGLGNPGELVVSNSVHGGFARCAYTSESIGKVAFVVGSLGYRA